MIRQFHRNESSWNARSRGTKVPRERMFHGTKVLGTFAPEERKFHRSESSKERMFHGTKVPRERKFSLWSFRSWERKCRETKRPGIYLSILWEKWLPTILTAVSHVHEQFHWHTGSEWAINITEWRHSDPVYLLMADCTWPCTYIGDKTVQCGRASSSDSPYTVPCWQIINLQIT